MLSIELIFIELIIIELCEIHNTHPVALKPCEVCSVRLREAGGLVLPENMVPRPRTSATCLLVTEESSACDLQEKNHCH